MDKVNLKGESEHKKQAAVEGPLGLQKVIRMGIQHSDFEYL